MRRVFRRDGDILGVKPALRIREAVGIDPIADRLSPRALTQHLESQQRRGTEDSMRDFSTGEASESGR